MAANRTHALKRVLLAGRGHEELRQGPRQRTIFLRRPLHREAPCQARSPAPRCLRARMIHPHPPPPTPRPSSPVLQRSSLSLTSPRPPSLRRAAPRRLVHPPPAAPRPQRLQGRVAPRRHGRARHQGPARNGTSRPAASRAGTADLGAVVRRAMASGWSSRCSMRRASRSACCGGVPCALSSGRC